MFSRSKSLSWPVQTRYNLLFCPFIGPCGSFAVSMMPLSIICDFIFPSAPPLVELSLEKVASQFFKFVGVLLKAQFSSGNHQRLTKSHSRENLHLDGSLFYWSDLWDTRWSSCTVISKMTAVITGDVNHPIRSEQQHHRPVQTKSINQSTKKKIMISSCSAGRIRKFHGWHMGPRAIPGVEVVRAVADLTDTLDPKLHLFPVFAQLCAHTKKPKVNPALLQKPLQFLLPRPPALLQLLPAPLSSWLLLKEASVPSAALHPWWTPEEFFALLLLNVACVFLPLLTERKRSLQLAACPPAAQVSLS